jgi:hypothetical protein
MKVPGQLSRFDPATFRAQAEEIDLAGRMGWPMGFVPGHGSSDR